jgi:raffinose/stachyose/melibiose transport system permease protein
VSEEIAGEGSAPVSVWRRSLRHLYADSIDLDFAVPRTGSPSRRGLVRAAEHAFMLTLCFFSLAPLYAMVVISLKTTPEFQANFASLAPPAHPTLSKFIEAWSGLGFSALVRNSVILAVASSAVTTVLSALAGFALARGTFPGRRVLLVTFIALMSVPAIVVVVPLFSLMAHLRLINTYPAAIGAEIGLLVPFATYLVYTFIREIPSELFNAAAVDGASAVRQLFQVALPLSRPVLATVALISAIWAWNDLLIPLILWQSEDLKVLPLVMAGVCISVIPIVALFILAKRFFIQGLVEGALK